MVGAASGRGPQGFLRLLRRSRRGRLKIYLGYSPGVGKTYQMLLEGRRLHEQGVDVVIGYVEPHGRPDTQSLRTGFEEVPRSMVEYRGIRVEEMDVGAILAREPEVVLVDEVAHTNVPGSRHPKRWQDVLEILDAGISVLTTLDVQQLESLYETVGRLVGVTVRERVPDWLVAEADQLVNVDIAVEDLRQRLEQGKIYPGEKTGSALADYFSPANLAQLRELALREAAAQAQRPGGRLHEGPALFAPDQVMVCLSSKGPAADALLRYGSRLAGRLDRNWFAVYVQTDDEEPVRLDAATQSQLAASLDLARTLGATVFTYRGDEVVGTILRFAREYGIGHVVMGRPGRRPWRDRLLARPGPVRGLLKRASGLTVVVVDSTSAAEARAPEASPKLAVDGADLLRAEAILILAGSPSPKELIELLLDRLLRSNPGLDGPAALQGLLQREREGSTFLDSGVGLPHARMADLRSPLAALALCPHAVAGAPRVTLLLLLPEDDQDQALELLGAVARLFRRDAAIEALVAAAGAEEAARLWASFMARR